MRIEGFDSRGVSHSPAYDVEPGGRTHCPTHSHAADVRRVNSLTNAQIKRARASLFTRSIIWHPKVTSAQCAAAREAFAQQKPYLAPENTVPAGCDVHKLLGQKRVNGANVHYGRISLRAKDAARFENFQRELAAIDPQIATRQLYQCMHGHRPTRIIFSNRGATAVIPGRLGENLVHINTTYTAVDPISGVMTPLCVTMGHEIEHANVPGKFCLSNSKIKDRVFTNVEEIRVINGYENAMLRALGQGQRTTHASFIVPLDPHDHSKSALPLRGSSGFEYLRPGQKLQGKIVAANRTNVTVLRNDGTRISIETPMLLATIMGNGQLKRLGFEDPSSVLEKFAAGYCAQRRVMKNAQQQRPGGQIDHEAKIFWDIQEFALESPGARYQIAKWQAAARRNDEITLSMSRHGTLNLHRVSTETGSEFAPALKKRGFDRQNLRNRAIAIILGSGTAAGLTLVIAYAAANSGAKKQSSQMPSAQLRVIDAPTTLQAMRGLTNAPSLSAQT